MNEKTLTLSQSKIDSGNSPSKSEGEMRLMVSAISSKPLTKEQLRVRGARTKTHSPEEIAREFRLDAQGNLFFAVARPGRSMLKPAGYVRKDGYRSVRLQDQTYLAHRVVWCLYFGRWPREQIDHINGNKLDNRIENLREVTVAENRLNIRRPSTFSGVVGVTWAKKEGNWRASISIKGKAINLGHFNRIEDAIKCRKQAEAKYGYLQF